jgi:hypothetical protein
MSNFAAASLRHEQSAENLPLSRQAGGSFQSNAAEAPCD